MMRRAAFPSVLAVCLATGLPCWSQRRPPGSETTQRILAIRGTLRFAADERGAEMIKIELKRFTGESVFTQFTGANGNFEFSNLVNGNYIVVVEEHGFEPIREDVELMNASRHGVLLYLKAPLVFKQTEPGPTVSARELSLPQKAVSSYRRGMDRLYQKKDYLGSVAQFERAIAQEPSYYEAYVHRGIAFREMQKSQEAVESFRKAIEISQEQYAEAFFALSETLSDTGQYDEAEAMARRGQSLDSNVWFGHFQLGRALFGQNRLDEAEKSVQEARTRRPAVGSVYLLLANIHIRGKNYPALLADLDKFLELEPKGPMSANARAMRETLLKNQAKEGQVPASTQRP